MIQAFARESLPYWAAAYFVVASMQTFCKRVEQGRMREGSEFTLPRITDLIFLVPWATLIFVAVIDWKWAIGLYAAGFALALSPILDTAGFLIFCILMPRFMFRRNK